MYMQLTDVVILGVIQGFTEFLPVSSSGHLLAARYLFGISDDGGVALDAFLHLGTLTAVLIYFRTVWFGIVRSAIHVDAGGRDKRELLAKLLLATVPAAVVGFLFEDIVASNLRSPAVLAGSFVFTAALLWLFDVVAVGDVPTAHTRATFRDAIIIGCWQVVALIPGVSRSGVTIAAGRQRGLSRRQATTFSFLLSAPIIAGAGVSSAIDILQAHTVPVVQLFVGYSLALACGLLAIHLLLKAIERVSFTPFAVYLMIMALVVVWYV